MFLFIAVASDTKVFIVELELLLRWLSLIEEGVIERKNKHADSSQRVCCRISSSKDQLFNKLTL